MERKIICFKQKCTNIACGKIFLVREISKYLLITGLLFSNIIFVFSQNLKVSGSITDASTGEPLVGVSVVVEGTTQGTVSDGKGAFTLESPNSNATLVFSYIGYSDEKVATAGQSVINVKMAPGITRLDEIVVVGYGVQKKKLVTGATVSVKGNDIQKLNTTNALQAIQGHVPGVNITSVSGQPGGEIRVIVRGTGTIKDASPTYVVDGVITGDITYLNTADIASIDILKDAASCAIYGVNGANGVVLITTRGGNKGAGDTPKAQVSFDFYKGIQNIARKVDLLNAREYATIVNEAAINSGKLPYFTQGQIAAMGTGTNWMDKMFSKDVPTQNYNIAVNGGNPASVYSMAFSYTQQGGIIGGTDMTDFHRYNFRVNAENKLYGDFLKIGEHLTYSHINKHNIQDGGIYGNSIRAAFSTSPFLPMYDSIGNYVSSDNYTMPYYSDGVLVNRSWTNGEANPYAVMKYTNQNEKQSDKLLGDVYAEFQLTKNLKFKSIFGLEYNRNNEHSYLPVYSLSVYALNTTEKITQSASSNYTWNWDNTINYLLKANGHNFDVMVGSSIRKYQGSNINGSNQGATIFGDLTHAYLGNSAITSIAVSDDKQLVTHTISAGGNADAVVAHESFFGRLNYNYKETYMGSLVFRADGSTYFAKGSQWGYFPSVSAGWVISNEKWLEPVKNLANFLKLRGSWGQNGNDKVDPFNYLSLITLINATYNIGGTDVPGSYPSTIGTRNLKWETSQQLNIGFDASFLDNRLYLNFDWYNKKTKDWLVAAPLLATAGVNTAPYINGGDVTNSGVEVQMAYNGKIGNDFTYMVSGSYTYNKNNVTEVPTEDGIIHGPTSLLYVNSPEGYRAETGHPIGYFWGYKTGGIFQNDSQIRNYVNSSGEQLQPNAEPGDIIYVDVNNDGAIDAKDRTDIGDPNPHHLFGINFSCSWKNFDFSITANGVAGNKIAQSYRDPSGRFGNWTTAVLGRWHGEGTSDKLPRVTEDQRNWVDFTDLYLHDGDYLRISNINLGYDLSKLVRFKYLSQCRIYVAAENLFTFTKYDGMDPEVGFSPSGGATSGFGQGLDVGFYPRPRTYLVGLNVKF